MKKQIKVSNKILRDVVDQARKYLLATPLDARIEGMTRPLTEGERIALAYINATLTVANGLGGDTAHIAVIFDDSEVMPT